MFALEINTLKNSKELLYEVMSVVLKLEVESRECADKEILNSLEKYKEVNRVSRKTES